MDHVKPKSRGGSDASANLRPAHKACNNARGSRTVKEIGGRAMMWDGDGWRPWGKK